MSSWYCQMPFKHVYVDSTGLSPCCQIPRRNTTLDQWHTNDFLLKLQQQHLSGQPSPSCQQCYHSEKQYGQSLRTEANRDYTDQVFTETQIDFVDFRSINICNFKCRSCNPVFSNGIAQESNRNPDLQKFYYVDQLPKTLAVDSANTDWILDHLPSLKRVMFTGGEPTYIPEVRYIIERIRQHYPHIQIIITSNASFQDKFWLDISQDLNVHWTLSIDAVGPRASIIRHGSDWSRVQQNVIRLCETANSVSINSVITCLSLFGLAPLLKFVREMQHRSRPPYGRHGDQGCRHQFYVCEKPYYLAATNWPESIQPRALSYVKNCLDLDLDQEQRDQICNLARSIETNEFDQQVWDSGLLYNQILDRIRNEDHTTLFQPQV